MPIKISLDKGVPKPGALIHAASTEHYALWMRGRQDGGVPWPGFALPAPTHSSSSPPLPTDPSSDGSGVGSADDPAAAAARGEGIGGEPGQEAPAGQALPPPIAIGATTSGGFSFLRGRGAGRAVCEAVAVRDALLLSAYFRRRQEVVAGSGGGGGGCGSGHGGQRQQRERRPWALVLVGNEAGGWLRPAVASLAAS